VTRSGFAPVDRLSIIDSHTEGEPTRVVLDGWPPLVGDTMAERQRDVASRFGHLRRAVVGEPRGSGVAVGALVTPPVESGSECGVIYFNDVGVLGMCGHGTIGLVRTLVHLGRVTGHAVRVDTPVGTVRAEVHDDGSVAVENVPARVHALDVRVHVPTVGWVTGDVAWGGNWFFLVHGVTDSAGRPTDGSREVATDIPLTLARVGPLTRRAAAIRDALHSNNIRGAHGAIIDHIELVGPSTRGDADARNFVLCPGVAYDRSPCGTGTSAAMAVRHARGELALGAPWRQESITGTLFTGWLTAKGDDIVPFIRGHAWITGETVLRFEADDPFRWGMTEAVA
jgi:4-hydroxyproline epimerase